MSLATSRQLASLDFLPPSPDAWVTKAAGVKHVSDTRPGAFRNANRVDGGDDETPFLDNDDRGHRQNHLNNADAGLDNARARHAAAQEEVEEAILGVMSGRGTSDNKQVVPSADLFYPDE